MNKTFLTTLTGVGEHIKLILRRDRLGLLVWVLAVALVPIGIAASFARLYPTAAAQAAYAAENMATPATVAALGPVYAPTLGGLVAWRTGLQGAVLTGVVSLLLIVRHTRVEETAGRRELLGGLAVGRHAALTAALAVVLVANLAIGALIALGLAGLGLPLEGAAAAGLSAASAGWIFAAVGAVAAQLGERPSTARGLGLSALALAYVARTLGDLGAAAGGANWLSWISPLGWVRLTRPFAGERWWVFGLVLGLVGALVVAAYALSARRDLGAGLLAARLGPATGGVGLRSPLALAWRLQRGGLLAWAAGAALLGGVLGAVGHSLSRLTAGTELQAWAQQAGMRDAGDAFLFMLTYVLGQMVAAYAIVLVLRLRVEEVEGRADPVLAAPVGRLRWAGGYLLLAFVNPALVLAALGLALGLGYGLTGGGAAEFLSLLSRTLVPLPAIWVMAGLAAAFVGMAPRGAAAGSWGLFALFLLLELGWELRQISPAVFNLSPFAHVHWARAVEVAPLLGLTAVAGALASAGLLIVRRRDVG